MPEIVGEFSKVLAVFGWAFFSFWTAIPGGIALGLHPIVVLITVVLSYTCGVLVVLLPSERIRAWVNRRWAINVIDQTDQDSLVQRMWERYGVIGFGLIAPMTVGAQIGTIIGVALQIPRRRFLVWMFLGSVIWAVLITLGVSLGVDLLNTG